MEIFLINWVADCFLRHALCAISVFFMHGKFLLEVVGSLSLWKYSGRIILQILSLGMHGVQCLFSFVMENFLLE